MKRQISMYVVLFWIDEFESGFKIFNNKHQAVAFIKKNEEDWKEHELYRSYEVFV